MTETVKKTVDRPGLAARLGACLGSMFNFGAFQGLFLKSAVWALGGHFLKMVLRLGGNLVLTRLLYPEAFGLMALINVFLQGLELFSDVGIGPSIIQHKRGEEREFLNTAWTIQVIRGGGLWLLACFLAWPLAVLYKQTQLLQLLPVVGLNAVLSGFCSPAFFTARRRLSLGLLTCVEVGSQVAGLLVMVVLAWNYPSVWALVAGGLVACFFNLIVSHRYMGGEPVRFCWEPEAVREVFSFGRWILISTALTFLASRGDRLIMGGFVTMADLGLYNIAYFLSQAAVQTVQAVSTRVLFPLYARIAGVGLQELRNQIGRIRSILLVVALPGVCVMTIGGQWIVDFLYDDRWREAGWMLQLLSVGAVPAVISATLEPVLLGVGNSKRHMLVQLARSGSLLACMAIGGMLGGLRGVVIGIAASNFFGYAATVWAVRKYGVWGYKRDALAFGGCGLIIGTWFLLKNFMM